MRSGQEPGNAGVTALPVFLAVGAIAVIAILVVLIAALSSPETTPATAIPGIGTNVTNASTINDPMNVPNVTEVTPTPSPRPYRIVVGEGVDPTPVPTQDPNSDIIVDQDLDKTPHSIAYAYQSNVTGLADMTIEWAIPQRPLYDGGPKHTIFLRTGIQQGSSGPIQCVLEWDHDHTGKYWTLACWVVNAKDQSYDVSRRIDAWPGDRIKAEMRYETDLSNPGQKVWHLILTDETHEVTTELIDSDGAVDTNKDLIVFGGVLEGIGPVSEGDDLPGDVTFENIVYKDESGKVIPVYLTGMVDKRFGHVAVEYNDGPGGSHITIHTNYSR
jgi:hypothetical protein